MAAAAVVVERMQVLGRRVLDPVAGCHCHAVKRVLVEYSRLLLLHESVHNRSSTVLHVVLKVHDLHRSLLRLQQV
jgi:hypothetical protein